MREPTFESSERMEEPDQTTPKIHIFTIGHSELAAEQLLELLKQHEIGRVVDVRSIPRSRHTPQFNKENLSPFLRIRGIKYLHVKELGGFRRHVKANTSNDGWENASFRGFADYMQSPAFSTALSRLMLLAKSARTAIMCAEVVPWRCHRMLIADALFIRGVEVMHIMPHGKTVTHTLNSMAVVQGTTISYPAGTTLPEQSILKRLPRPRSLPLKSGTPS